MIYIGLMAFGISVVLMFFFSFFWMIQAFVNSVKLATDSVIIRGISYIIAAVLFVIISVTSIVVIAILFL